MAETTGYLLTKKATLQKPDQKDGSLIKKSPTLQSNDGSLMKREETLKRPLPRDTRTEGIDYVERKRRELAQQKKQDEERELQRLDKERQRDEREIALREKASKLGRAAGKVIVGLGKGTAHVVHKSFMQIYALGNPPTHDPDGNRIVQHPDAAHLRPDAIMVPKSSAVRHAVPTHGSLGYGAFVGEPMATSGAGAFAPFSSVGSSFDWSAGKRKPVSTPGRSFDWGLTGSAKAKKTKSKGIDKRIWKKRRH